MARRFGRNQRRKLLAELSATQHALGQAVYGQHKVARPETPLLTSLGTVVGFVDTTDRDGMRWDRQLDVSIYPRDEEALDRLESLVRYHDNVVWRGIEWRCKGVKVENIYAGDYGYAARIITDRHITLELQVISASIGGVVNAPPMTAQAWASIRHEAELYHIPSAVVGRSMSFAA